MKKIFCLFVVVSNWAIAHPTYFKVEGDSMLPNIKPGSTVFTDNRVKISELQTGDIIVFVAGKDYVVHRFFRRDGVYYTKGDNNSNKDRNYITEKTFIGKVIRVY